MVKNITIYTTNTCAYCVMVEKFLDMKQQKYELVNLDEHPERVAEAVQISGGLAVPITVVTHDDDSHKVVVGYNIAQLNPALA